MKRDDNVEGERANVFLVDDNITNLTAGRSLLKQYYNVFPLSSAHMLVTLMERVIPDIILLDIAMPEMDGYETIKYLKADERYCEIPVIFLTAKNEEADEVLGFELGAVDYIAKPFSPMILKKRVENHLLILEQRKEIQNHAASLAAIVHDKTREILNLQHAILNTMADLMAIRDGLTGGHSYRTLLFTEVLLNEVINNEAYIHITYSWNMDVILLSSQLHDIGKLSISDAILNKPGKLTSDEFTIMKTHAATGSEAIRRMMSMTMEHTFLNHACNFAGSHHERWNGKGYPNGLSKDNIPLEGRIMAIVDTYDALISWRPYKKAFSHEKAVSIIKEGKGVDFDPRLVDIFLKVEKEFESIALSCKENSGRT